MENDGNFITRNTSFFKSIPNPDIAQDVYSDNELHFEADNGNENNENQAIKPRRSVKNRRAPEHYSTVIPS